MKLRESMRCELAERICRRWIQRRRLKLKTPTVYLINRMRSNGHAWGWCSYGPRRITLHVGPQTNLREVLVLLAHEFAHYLNYWTSTPRWRRLNPPHGERFQRLLWGTLPKVYWPRASQPYWMRGASAHRPEFQPVD